MSYVRRVVIGALSASAIGCAGGDGFEAMATKPQAIINGEASGASQDGVLLLRAQADGAELLCTASLVAPNLVVTARHCVSYLTEGPFSCSVRGELYDNPSGGGRLGLHLAADTIELYDRKTPRKSPIAHGVQVISTLSPSICENDLAFVVLDTALTLPPVPLRLGRSARVGETTVLVGYGLDENDLGIDYRTQPRRQKRDLIVAAVGPDSISDGVTTVPPRAVILEGPSGCVGDSGGPLLSQETGALLGVYSLLAGSTCEAKNAYQQLVHVPPFQALIDDAFAAAMAEPLLEPEPELGAGGASPGAAGADAGAGGSTKVDDPAGGAAAAADEPTPRAPPKHSGCALSSPKQSPCTAAVALLGALAFVRRRRAR